MGLCLHDISAQAGLFSSLLLAGLAGGFTHCIPMCGPFVLAQHTDFKNEKSPIRRLSGTALLPYHLGRTTTYVILAILFSSLLNAALLFSPLKSLAAAILLLCAALIFMVNIIPALGQNFPYLAYIRLPIPQTALARLAAPFTSGQTLAHQYILGLLLGFMPCGLVIAALMTAIAIQSPLLSGLAMVFFGLGTIPALALASTGVRMIGHRWPQSLKHMRVLMLIISAGLLVGTAGHTLVSWS
ncbi:MAG: sulfite exporter TauE/SafE family protein [Micavibrio aeruginosavorus]|uniref:Sulfite exporter TauE/SafE family protein n=1 Tax=Micavibrio aeruginosavorus TaxID=349221 RepID=A0A7T5R1I2_9BACT|nr:MAG: sulfite exporter TauE/SafE family protein [Micavibrio aeruginosavorus]